MLDILLQWDQNIFQWINQQWSNHIFDTIFPILRNKYVWIPLYIFLLAFVAFNFGRKLWWFLLFSLITVALADNISSRVLKPLVKRDRPCKQLDQVNVLVRCGSGYSFTSSHATNHFAIGTFFMLSLGFVFKRYKYLFLLWAGLISLAQVYVGVHYPLDILIGGGIGYLCGVFVYWVYRFKSGLSEKIPEQA